MDTFYTISFVSIRPVIKEQISLGLIVANGRDIQFEYSKSKLKALNKLMSHNIVDFIRLYLKAMKKVVLKFDDPIFSKYDYYNRLSNYNNNLLIFSKPKNVDIELTDYNFKRLFELYIFKKILLK